MEKYEEPSVRHSSAIFYRPAAADPTVIHRCEFGAFPNQPIDYFAGTD